MKGHIQRRGARSWRLKYDLPRASDGSRRVQFETINGTKRDAERILAERLHSINKGGFVHPSKISVRELLERWLCDHAAHRVSRKTFEEYERIVRTKLMPELGGHFLQQLSPMHLTEFYSKSLASGRIRRAGGLSARSVYHFHKVLHQALDRAVKWQLVARNVAEAVEPPRPKRTEARVFTPDQLSAVLREAGQSSSYAPLLIAAVTGMRRSEVLGLRWSSVDLDAARVQVTQVMEKTKGKLALKEPKTQRSRRLVTLPDVAVEALRRHRSQQAELRLQLGLGRDPDGLVFTDELGQPIEPDTLSRRFTRIARKVTGQHFGIHALRHSHATHLLQSGVHPKVVSERLGHASISITMDTYSHVAPTMQEDVARIVDASLRTALSK